MWRSDHVWPPPIIFVCNDSGVIDHLKPDLIAVWWAMCRVTLALVGPPSSQRVWSSASLVYLDPAQPLPALRGVPQTHPPVLLGFRNCHTCNPLLLLSLKRHRAALLFTTLSKYSQHILFIIRFAPRRSTTLITTSILNQNHK